MCVGVMSNAYACQKYCTFEFFGCINLGTKYYPSIGFKLNHSTSILDSHNFCLYRKTVICCCRWFSHCIFFHPLFSRILSNSIQNRDTKNASHCLWLQLKFNSMQTQMFSFVTYYFSFVTWMGFSAYNSGRTFAAMSRNHNFFWQESQQKYGYTAMQVQ